MTSKKTTRRALLSSVMSLLLCCSMLLGTTFAWFTDSVTSTGNIIKSGTLDVEMSWCDTNSTTESDWKDAAAGAIFDYKFWEPGYTQVKYVKIENVGDLAFKYQLNIVPDAATTGLYDLADVIDAYLVPAAQAPADRAAVDAFMAANEGATITELIADPDGAAYGIMYPVAGTGAANMTVPADAVEGEITYCIILHMQEEAGNEYQNLSVGDGFSVQLLATQLTAEIDSFGPDYDMDAEYDEVYVPVTAAGSTSVADKVDAANTLTEAVSVGDKAGTATFAAGTKLADGATELSFKVSGVEEAHANTTVGTNDDVIPLNIEVEGLHGDNTKPVTIKYQTLPGLQNVVVYHEGSAMNQSADGLAVNTYYYNGTTGIITITSDSFSPFDLVFEGYDFISADKTKVYYDFAEVLNDGGAVMARDVELAKDTTTTITAGQEIVLDLNGYTLSSTNTRTATHNFMIDVNGGTLKASNGTITMKHTGTNMEWNGAATVIDITAGGVLELNNVTVENEGGTDMNFAVHLNNWGEVTLNADNCVFKAPYCPVRVFNSGFDMNNVTITNSALISGGNRAFWVHNYIGDLDATKHTDDAVKARLDLDIFNGTNTFKTESTLPPIRYGFNTTVFFDENGDQIVTVSTADALVEALAAGGNVALMADITVEEDVFATIPTGVSASLNLNGHNINATLKGDSHTAVFYVDKGAELTVNGEGQVHAFANKSMSTVSVIFNNVGGDLVINGGTYTMNYGTYDEGYLLPSIVDTNNNVAAATTTINGGTFYHTRNMFRNFAQNRATAPAKLVINGGTFNGQVDDSAAIWNQKTSGANAEGSGLVEINGGVFNYVEITNDYQTGVTIADGVNIQVVQ